MLARTTILASVLALGLGSTALAQSLHVETPGFGLSFGEPHYGPDHYSYAYDDSYGYDSYGAYAYTPDTDAYAYAPDVYVRAPTYGYGSGWSSRAGDRANERIYSGAGGPYLQDDYNNQTGINNN